MPGAVVARNLARDPQIVRRVERDFLPLLRVVREDRVTFRETLLRYHRIFGLKRDLSGYVGRTQTYLPIGRKLIENWVKRLKRDLFPDTDWHDVRALRQVFERRVPGVKALNSYFFEKHMRLRRQASPYLRGLVTYGTAPVKVVWRQEEREQTILRDLFDEEGQPTGRWEQKLEKVVDYLGPTFRPVDIFAWYVWPTTCLDVDDATLVFEDLLVPRDRVFAMGEKPLSSRDPKAGMVYENVSALRKQLDEQDTFVAQGAREKFEAAARRLTDKGFTHPLDARLPASMRPVDLTEAMWTTDLGEGTKRYLVAVSGDAIVHRVQANPFMHGRSLWLAGKFVEVINEFYGRGLPELFESLQRFLNDVADQSGDALVWATNPIAVVDAYGVQDPDSLRMSPGAKWLAQLASVKFMEPPQGPAQAGFAAVSALMGMTDTLANVTPVAAMGTAQRGRSRSQSTASGMQIAATEGAVDVREVVENQEDQVFNPLLYRTHSLALQFLDRDVILKITGADGVALVDTPLNVPDLIGDYEFEWLGSTAAQNTQVRAQQQINYLGMVSKIPRDMLDAQNVEIDLKFLLRDIYGTGLGLRGAERVVRDKVKQTSVDWRLENEMFRVGRGAEVVVAESDDDLEHAKGHDLLLADRALEFEVKRAAIAHIRAHVAASLVKQAMKAMQAQQQQLSGLPGAPAGPGGASPPGGAVMAGGPRLPPPAGPGRMAQTGSLDDLMRQLPRAQTV